MMVYIKYILIKSKMNDPIFYLSNFALNLMIIGNYEILTIIGYLQSLDPPILPNLQSPELELTKETYRIRQRT